MKQLILTLALILMTTLSQAAPETFESCTNNDASIRISNNQVAVVTSKLPVEIQEVFEPSDLNITSQLIQIMPSEVEGCTYRSVGFRSVTLTKKDGTPMPDGYNRLAKNGSLSDYFICTVRFAWSPAAGANCK